VNKDYGQLLSICIPTYNRADRLKRALPLWIDKVSKYNIRIVISDNASLDNTQAVVKEFQTIYNNIFYSRNDTNIGPDKNYEKVLTIADTEYRWLMGDDDECKGDFEALFRVLDKDYDIILLNFPRIIDQVNSEKYIDMNKLMFDLGASTTFISSLIFHKRVIKSPVFSEVYNSEFAKHFFAHSAVVFSYVANQSGKVFFLADFSVCGLNTDEPVSWANLTFQYFVNELNITADLLPEFYTKKSKRAYSRKIRTHFFGMRAYYIHAYRAKLDGKFSVSYFFKSYKNIKRVFNLGQRLVLFNFALYPKILIKTMFIITRGVYRFLKYTIRGKKHPSKIANAQGVSQ